MFKQRELAIYENTEKEINTLFSECVENDGYVARTGAVRGLSVEAFLSIQLQKILLDISSKYEHSLSENELIFFQKIAEGSFDELCQYVEGYNSFWQFPSNDTFWRMERSITAQIDGIPWGIVIALAMDGENKDQYTTETSKHYSIILDSFVFIEPDNIGTKSEIVNQYLGLLSLNITSQNPSFHGIDNQIFLNQIARLAKSEGKKTAEQKGADEKTLAELLTELRELPGLYNAKKNVEQIISMLNVRKEMERRGLPATQVSMHMVFVGNPGTGKTTIARLIAEIYKKMGLLEKGQLIEADRSSLVAGYIGQTEIKTKEVIESAMGGVLFIDEAYTLADGQGENDYGQEVISILLKEMEDKRDKFVVIVAGYPGKMDKFLNSNPGLKSRFSETIYFDDYSDKEMFDIFRLMCKRAGYRPTRECLINVRDKTRKYCKLKPKGFANGRDVRNFFEKAIREQNIRVSTGWMDLSSLSDADLLTLKLEDVQNVEYRDNYLASVNF